MLMLLPPTPSLPLDPAVTEQITYIAQAITPATDGTGTVVTINGNTFDITGGQSSGANLFHSFEQFGLNGVPNSLQVADFITSSGVENIVGRIVGGDVSSINGLLRVSGSDANLFLVNPSGIILGPNASLDLRGSFTASTNDRLNAGNNWWTNWNSQLFTTPNDSNSVVFTVGAPATRLGDDPGPLSLGSRVSLTNGAFVSGDLTVPGNDISITGGSIITGNIDTAGQAGGTVTLVAIAGGIITGNIYTLGDVIYTSGDSEEEDDVLSLRDGSVSLTSFGDLRTGEIDIFSNTLSSVTDDPFFDQFNAIAITSTHGNISISYARSGPGGISISAPRGLFRAEGAIDAALHFQDPNLGQPQTFYLPLRGYPELVAFLEVQGLAVRDPVTNEPYPTTVPVVFPDCSGGFCDVPTSLWVIVGSRAQLPGQSLIRIEHAGQSLSVPGITIQGANGGEKPAFVAGPNLTVENPERWVGNFNSFDPNRPRQSFIISVSPSFRLLNPSTELPPEVSGTVGGIFITPSNAAVYSSILNRPFVPETNSGGNGGGGGGNGGGGGGNDGGGGGNGGGGGGNGQPTVTGEIPPDQVVGQILGAVSPLGVSTSPLLSIAEDVLTRPCSVSELTMAADGRYVLSGCEP